MTDLPNLECFTADILMFLPIRTIYWLSIIQGNEIDSINLFSQLVTVHGLYSCTLQYVLCVKTSLRW